MTGRELERPPAAAPSSRFVVLSRTDCREELKGLAMTDEQHEALRGAVDRVSREGRGTRILGSLIETGGSLNLNEIRRATFHDHGGARVDGALAFMAAANLADLLHQAIQNIRYLRRRP